MPFNTFGGGTVQPSDVSYRAVALTASVELVWPTLSQTATDVVARIMDVTPSSAGFSITMPDGRESGTGMDILFYNLGSDSFTILSHDTGSTLGTVGAGEAKLIYLTDNSTEDGSWQIFTFGTGTSGADASALAGYGILAIGSTLNQKHDVAETSSVVNIASSDRAKAYVFTAGTLAANLPTSASVGSTFFFILRNGGSGTITITPSGADTIDGGATLDLSPGDSCIVYSAGSANRWWTVGLGRAVEFAFTQLVKDVGGSSDVTLTSAECGNKVMSFIGILTGNINVIVTNTVSVYYVYNNTTGSFTLTVKTAAGTGATVSQGARDILVCDTTNVYRGITNQASTTAFDTGSEALPSITFIGDTDTGIYRPAANQVATTGGGGTVIISSGVASAVNDLTVTNSATGNPVLVSATGGDAAVGLTLRTQNASAPVTALTLAAAGGATFPISVTASNLTSGRLAQVGTAGLVQDSATFTYTDTAVLRQIQIQASGSSQASISLQNTHASGDALIQITATGTGDSYIGFTADTFWCMGIDNSVSDQFVISRTSIGSNDRLRLTAAGALTLTNYAAGIATFDGSGTITSETSAVRATIGLGTLTMPLMSYGGYGFDGSTDYLDGNALTGIADGKKFTWVGVLRFAGAAASSEIFFSNTGAQFQVRRTNTGNIEVLAENSAGTGILSQVTTGTPCSAAGTYVLMISADMATGGSFRLYINDTAPSVTSTTFTNDTIDFTVAEYSIGATTGGATFFAGDIYGIYFNSVTNIEFNTTANRRLFTNADNVPLYLGARGELPTGSTPIGFWGYDDHTSWPRNRGSATATTFTENGTPSAATTQLSGQYMPLRDYGIPKTVAADYTVDRTDVTIINNRAATNTLTLPDATTNSGRELDILTIQAQTVVSASSNVSPITSATPGTAILGAVDGAWAKLKSDGISWRIIAS